MYIYTHASNDRITSHTHTHTHAYNRYTHAFIDWAFTCKSGHEGWGNLTSTWVICGCVRELARATVLVHIMLYTYRSYVCTFRATRSLISFVGELRLIIIHRHTDTHTLNSASIYI